jgi:transcriptional regulator with XRE-family HTH domain
MKSKSTPSMPAAVLPYNMLVGKILQKRRELIEKNQSEIAEASELTQSAYSRIESGQTAITISNLRVICRALGLSADAVIKEADGLAKQLESQGVSVPLEKPEDGDNLKAALLIGLGVLLLIFAASR